MKRSLRRVAVHKAVVSGKTLNTCVIEIEHGVVVDCYEFTKELPFTEWIGGVAVVKTDEENRLRAYDSNGELIL